MRRFTLHAAMVAIAFGCAPQTDDVRSEAADTAQQSPDTPGTVKLADFAGTWSMRTMPMDKDTVLTTFTWIATADSSGWGIKFPDRPDTIPVQVLHVAGDSVMTRFGPYSSRLRKNVTVVTESVDRIQNGELTARITAHYSVPTADSIVHLRAAGTRAQ